MTQCMMVPKEIRVNQKIFMGTRVLPENCWRWLLRGRQQTDNKWVSQLEEQMLKLWVLKMIRSCGVEGCVMVKCCWQNVESSGNAPRHIRMFPRRLNWGVDGRSKHGQHYCMDFNWGADGHHKHGQHHCMVGTLNSMRSAAKCAEHQHSAFSAWLEVQCDQPALTPDTMPTWLHWAKIQVKRALLP